MKAFRWLLGVSLVAAVGWQTQSHATVVAAMPLAELVSMSEWVVVAQVQSAKSHYETIGGSRRMVTDTVLSIEQAILPNRSSNAVETGTITVRTLGGTIGEVAQYVPGEAVLAQGSSQMVFLDEGSDGVFRVSAMAQGQYPIVVDDHGQRKLRPSSGLDVVVHPEQSAVTVLAGQTVEQAQAMMQNVRKMK